MGLTLKRVVHGEPKTQVWLVEGGPGGSAVIGFQALARKMIDRPDIDLYAVDHRGTGGSNALSCPAQERASSAAGASIADEEWAACEAELRRREAENLPFVTTTASMRDLALLVERTRMPGVRVILYGISYGTYAVHRFMQLFPGAVDGIVLEGISAPGDGFDSYDADMDAAGKELFDACAADASCRAHFDDDPWKVAGDVVASMDSGHCAALGLDADGARRFLGGYLALAVVREYLPAIVRRMQRCSEADVDALGRFYRTVAGLRGPAPGRIGTALHVTEPLFFHVALSEMWFGGQRPQPADVRARFRATTMATGLTVRLADRQATWPVYTPGSEANGTFAAFDRPVLMLQGTLDPATPLHQAVRVRDAFRGPHQHWVEFPHASHAIVEVTPTKTGTDCGREVLFQFLDDPEGPVDTGCTQALAPLDFDGTRTNNLRLFGVPGAWD